MWREAEYLMQGQSSETTSLLEEGRDQQRLQAVSADSLPDAPGGFAGYDRGQNHDRREAEANPASLGIFVHRSILPRQTDGVDVRSVPKLLSRRGTQPERVRDIQSRWMDLLAPLANTR